MNLELMGALNELEKERGISKDVLLEAIEVAIVSAYKRNYGSNSAMSVRVDISEQTGEIHVFSRKAVVEEVNDPSLEISLEEARTLDPNFQLGDIVEQEVTPKDFGRIAAQTAKQVVIQRIREAERSIVYNEYSNREGDVVYGTVQRQEYKNIIVDLGKVEAVLPASEQIPREAYPPHKQMKFYINEVKQSTKGPQVFLSRTHPGLLKHLFEVEVPEIQSGEVEIKSVAREAGNRSKIAVYSREEGVDPVGACVGARGSRVQAVVGELNGEKIDIIQWKEDPTEFIANALSPAKVVRVVLDEPNKVARTVVPDDQLSLAIGKEGQNARLSARLTGWKIDIKSEAQAEDLPEFQEKAKSELESALFDQLDEELTPPTKDEIAQEVPVEVEQQSDEESIAKQGNKEQDPGTGQPKEIDLEELENLTNVKKRKSWEERFGRAQITPQEKQEPDKEKRKRKDKDKEKDKEEKVIKDFSMLDLEDFGFDDNEK